MISVAEAFKCDNTKANLDPRNNRNQNSNYIVDLNHNLSDFAEEALVDMQL